MAQIILKNSETAGDIPTTSQLQKGEPAFNLADNILYTKDKNGVIKKWKNSDYYDFTLSDLSVTETIDGYESELNFSTNKIHNKYQLEGDLLFKLSSSGNVEGNRITCVIIGDGISTVKFPTECKIVHGSFDGTDGVHNLIEFQFFSIFIITKIYKIP